MIESYYWKEDLLNHAKRLKPVKKPKRWSERAVVNFEKELIISFFYIRKLFEDHKVSKISRNYECSLSSYQPSGKKITWRNHFDIHSVYNLDEEKSVKIKIFNLANQFIHSCTMFAYRGDDRNWDGVYVCSDQKRKEMIYRISVEEIIRIFLLVGSDYPLNYSMTWNENIDDYEIKSE